MGLTADGSATVHIVGGNGSVNVTYSGLIGSITVDSCGTLLPGSGPIAYTNKTCDPEIVTFHAPVQPVASPTNPPASTSYVPCVTIFTSSPFCTPLPASPTISPSSAAWSALEFQSGRDSIAGLGFGGSNEASEPVATLLLGDPTVAMLISCDTQSYSAGTCSHYGIANGSTQLLPPGAYVETNADGHLSIESVALQGEIDFWNITTAGKPIPSTPGTLHVGGAGFCKWASDGTGCSGSTATEIATSLGDISGDVLQAAESDPVHGTLGHAIAISLLCADPSFVYPATASDGANTNSSSACVGHTAAGQRPPEGTRFLIRLHDADINATSNAPYVKVILRTMDEDHYGGVATDTNWSGAPGIAPQYGHDGFAFAETEAGLTGSTFVLPITTNGIDLATQSAWCSNGTCAP